jgi:hypothetical protein
MDHRFRIALFAVTILPSLLPADEQPGITRWSLTVTETEGIRRFGYPVHAALPVDRALLDRGQFRLLQNDKPVPAQFSPHRDGEKGPPSVSVDFNVNHAPLEEVRYLIEYSPSGDAPRAGTEMKAEISKETVKVLHPGNLEFELPRDLLGMLRQVRAGRTEYLRADSPGLFFADKDHIQYRAGGLSPDGTATTVRVTRAGSMAAGLWFEGNEVLRGGRMVSSFVEMEFPRSKSWVRVAWTVDDPNGYVAGLGAELNLNVQGEPTLVDFGAGSLVYAQLRRGRTTLMRAGSLGRKDDASQPAWTTLLGDRNQLSLYVVASKRKDAPPAEGWAHVMDRERCTALAVAGFADVGQESEIRIDADGRLLISRTFARDEMAVPRGPKQLTFWLHFVPMPVHVGAATSPQAMLAPLRVEVKALEQDKR